MLAEAGLVSSSLHGPRRLSTITDAGRAWLEEQRAELDAINAQLDEAAAPIGETAIGEASTTSAAPSSPRCARARSTPSRPAGCAA
jgi:DNA-binding PadR family transcriptional regulator